MDPERIQREGLALGDKFWAVVNIMIELKFHKICSRSRTVDCLRTVLVWKRGNRAMVCCFNLMCCDVVSFTLLWQIS